MKTAWAKHKVTFGGKVKKLTILVFCSSKELVSVLGFMICRV